MHKQFGCHDIARWHGIGQVQSERPSNLLPKQAELGEHISRVQTLLKPGAGVALCGLQHGRILKRRTRIRSRGTHLQK